MTLDGFVTFLALAAAIYAVISPVSKLRARLGWVFQIPVALGALSLVLYLELFQALGQPCPSALGHACEWLEFPTDNSITPPQVAFLVVLIWLAIAWAIHRFSSLGAGPLPAMSRLVDDLVYEQRFAEVLKLVEPHLPVIGQAARRNLPLQRLHDRVAVMRGNDISLRLRLSGYDWEKVGQDTERGRFPIMLRRCIGTLAAFIPSQRQAKTSAEDITRVLFRSANLNCYIARMRPYFATSLLRLDLYGFKEFSDAFFDALISEPGSILYQELQQNQGTSTPEGYSIPEYNRLLHFLFADAHVAEKLRVYRPIGEHLLKILRPGNSPNYAAYLNRSAKDFDDERWQDPTFIGIFFFDLMVTRAAYQGVQWHMWLYYLPLIVKRLVDLYDTSNPAVDTSSEFPTRSARLIYEALSALRDWVGLVANLSEDSPHRQIPTGFSPDNGNIPISAAIALGRCMVTISNSAQIDDKFAGYMHEVIMWIRNFRIWPSTPSR